MNPRLCIGCTHPTEVFKPVVLLGRHCARPHARLSCERLALQRRLSKA